VVEEGGVSVDPCCMASSVHRPFEREARTLYRPLDGPFWTRGRAGVGASQRRPGGGLGERPSLRGSRPSRS